MRLVRTLAKICATWLIGLVLSGCFFDSSAIMHYQVTATIEVNGRIMSASAVQEIRVVDLTTFGFGMEMTMSAEHQGQAIMIDLPGHEDLVFVMTDNSGGGSYAWKVLTACGIVGAARTEREVVDLVAHFVGPCDVPVDEIPAMIRIDNAETVPVEATWVDLENPQDTLRPNVRILSFRLEKTDLPLVYNLGEKLPWLALPRGNPLVAAKHNTRFKQLGVWDFMPRRSEW
jgi:hypothetical protein